MCLLTPDSPRRELSLAAERLSQWVRMPRSGRFITAVGGSHRSRCGAERSLSELEAVGVRMQTKTDDEIGVGSASERMTAEEGR
jgi:hypothetical protein